MKPTRENALKIINTSAAAFAVKPVRLMSADRNHEAVMAKQVAFFLIHTKLDVNPRRIAEMLRTKLRSIYYHIRAVETHVNSGSKHGRLLQGKIAEVAAKLSRSKVVRIEVVCGVAFVRSKPDDVEVEIVTKQ